MLFFRILQNHVDIGKWNLNSFLVETLFPDFVGFLIFVWARFSTIR